MRKVSSERGMAIIRQGAQQFMALWEDFNCPFDERKQPVERKLWMKGWHEAKIKWFQKFEQHKKFAEKRRNSWQRNKQSIRPSTSQQDSVR